MAEETTILGGIKFVVDRDEVRQAAKDVQRETSQATSGSAGASGGGRVSGGVSKSGRQGGASSSPIDGGNELRNRMLILATPGKSLVRGARNIAGGAAMRMVGGNLARGMFGGAIAGGAVAGPVGAAVGAAVAAVAATLTGGLLTKIMTSRLNSQLSRGAQFSPGLAAIQTERALRSRFREFRRGQALTPSARNLSNSLDRLADAMLPMTSGVARLLNVTGNFFVSRIAGGFERLNSVLELVGIRLMGDQSDSDPNAIARAFMRELIREGGFAANAGSQRFNLDVPGNPTNPSGPVFFRP